MTDNEGVLRLKTTLPLHLLEQLLQKKCRSGWDMQLEGIGEDTEEKILLISFEEDTDLFAFQAIYREIFQPGEAPSSTGLIYT